MTRPAGFEKWHGLRDDPPGVVDKRVVVIFRSGREFDTIYPYSHGLDWKHRGNSTDIVYFKVVEN